MSCGERMARDAVVVPNPVVVVEALSPRRAPWTPGPSSPATFVPSIQHYLIVRADRRAVVHHRRRDGGGGIETQLVTEGRITRDPPGISVLVEDLYAP